ncbi:hypothetical protein EV639_101190 [Rathayibacter tanaceti]|uniref:Uncharacterized protein n=1 Tax=Rathayibacter tanaceti TaxID=1671680 RepID=A0ACD2XNM2_9MICO|nr:hypothetical protein EV639_101190 [Rathayibacter tanaceti]
MPSEFRPPTRGFERPRSRPRAAPPAKRTHRLTDSRPAIESMVAGPSRSFSVGPRIRFGALRREDDRELGDDQLHEVCAVLLEGDCNIDRSGIPGCHVGRCATGEGDGEVECPPLAPLGVHTRPFKSEETQYGGVQCYRAAMREFSGSSARVTLTLDAHRAMDARTKHLLGASARANFYGRVAEMANPCGTANDDKERRLSTPALHSAPSVRAGRDHDESHRREPWSRCFRALDPRLLGATVKDVLATEHVTIRAAYLGSIIHPTGNRPGLAREAERSVRRAVLDLVEGRRRASRRDQAE